MTKKIDEIELHSKEVQDLLGRMPSWLIRNGIVMVMLILVLLVAGSWLFKYPDIVTAPVVVMANGTNSPSFSGYVQLGLNGVGKVKVGQRVNLKFVSYPYLQFGTVKGIVSKVSSLPTGDAYALEVDLPDQMVTSFGKRLEFKQELKGTAEILTEDISLLDRMLKPIGKLFGSK